MRIAVLILFARLAFAGTSLLGHAAPVALLPSVAALRSAVWDRVGVIFAILSSGLEERTSLRSTPAGGRNLGRDAVDVTTLYVRCASLGDRPDNG